MDKERSKKMTWRVLVIVILLVVAVGYLFYREKRTCPSSGTTASVPVPSGTGKIDAASGASSSTNQNKTSALSGSNVVQISNMKFDPATITVKTGQAVVFVNNDSVEHSVTADNGTFDLSFNSGVANISMSQPGTYKYHCKIHPSMTGTIIWQ